MTSRRSGIAWSFTVLTAIAAVGTAAEEPPCTTWQVLNPQPQHRDLAAVVYGPGRFVAVGKRGTIVTSPDGVGWMASESPVSTDLAGVAWSGARLVAVGTGGTVLGSADGLLWTTSGSPIGVDLAGVAAGDPGFVAVGAGGAVLRSPDGEVWTQTDSGATADLRAVVWSGASFVAVGSGGTILTSADGAVWAAAGSGTDADLVAVAANGGVAVATGQGAILSSTDLRTWHEQFEYDGSAAAWTGERFLVMTGSSTYRRALTSPDGLSWWWQEDRWDDTEVRGFAFAGLIGVRVGSAGHIAWSDDRGAHWLELGQGIGFDLSGLAAGGETLVAVGSSRYPYGDSLILTGQGPTTWRETYWRQAETLFGVASSGSRFVAVGTINEMWGDPLLILTSGDGGAWQLVTRFRHKRADPPSWGSSAAITWDGGRFLLAAWDALGISSDGQEWQWRWMDDFPSSDVAGSPDLMVAVDGHTVVRSSDLELFERVELDPGFDLHRVAWSGERFVAVGAGGLVFTSSDGAAWSPVESGTTADLWAVEWTGSELVAAGDQGTLLLSADGNVWTAVPTGLDADLYAVLRTPSGLLVAGEDGLLVRQACVPAGSPPAAAFAWQPMTPRQGQPVAFIDLSQGEPTAWQWELGDGTTSELATLTHTYQEAGTYHVSLVASNGNGSAAAERLVAIAPARARPAAPVVVAPEEVASGAGYMVTVTPSPPPHEIEEALHPSFDIRLPRVYDAGDYPGTGPRRHIAAIPRSFYYRARSLEACAGTTERDSATFVSPWSETAVTLVEPAQYVYLVDAAAHNPGLYGTTWRTYLEVLNPGDQEAKLETLFLRSRQDNTASLARHEESLAPGCWYQVDDVVGELLSRGAEETSGALLIGADRPLLVGARTSNCDEGGERFSLYTLGVPAERVVASGEEVRLIMLESTGDTSGFHTNLGFANASGVGIEVEAEILAADGRRLGGRAYRVSPYGHLQDSSVIGDLTQDEVHDAYAVVRSSTPGARYLPYASVVDNWTGDSVQLSGAIASSGEPLWVPGVGHLQGFNGTVWRSDLEIHNPGPGVATYTVELLRRDQPNLEPESRTFSLAAGCSQRHLDVLDTVFAFAGAATLRITPVTGSIMAAARTYDKLWGQTWGELVEAVPSSRVFHAGQIAFLGQLHHNLGPLLRTNLGVVSTTGSEMTLQLTLYLSTSVRDCPLQSEEMTLTLAPFESRQLDDILAPYFNHGRGEGYALLRSDSPDAGFLAYASLVNLYTGDPYYIPARLVP